MGQCIYCGATDGLTNEHIIPFGLLPKGGDWFLPKSSCPVCADITKRFEDVVLRGMYGPIRQKMELKTRRKKGPNINVRRVYRGGAMVDETVDITQFPPVCLGFKWPIPGIVMGNEPTNAFVGEIVAKIDEEAAKRFAPEGEGFRIGTVGPLHFARMLAKIAHAYAVGEYGADAFDPLLPPLIRGETDLAPYLVGGDHSGMPTKPGALHDIHRQDCRRDQGTDYFGVSIQLFACFDLPRYHVIVGRRLSEAPERRLGDTIAVQLPMTSR